MKQRSLSPHAGRPGFSYTEKANEPRLRIPNLEGGEDTHRSAHEGALHFGRGCFMAIRNIVTHTLTQPEEQPGLEALAALSVLARWIDAAEVRPPLE